MTNYPYPELVTALDELARIRAKLHPLKNALDAMQQAFNIEIAPMKNERSVLMNAETAAYSTVRQLAVAFYEATGDKHPDPDVIIRKETEPHYNPAGLIAWALENGRLDLLRIVVDEKELMAALSADEHSIPKTVASLEKTYSAAVGTKLAHRLMVKGE